MNESDFSRELRKSLESRGGYFVKMVGGPFVAPGIPDIIGCFKGKFIGIECKQIKVAPRSPKAILWKNIFSDMQIKNLQRINEAGGIGFSVIHLAYKRPHIALCLSVQSILNLQTITVENIEGLLMLQAMKKFILTRKPGGEWDVSSIVE